MQSAIALVREGYENKVFCDGIIAAKMNGCCFVCNCMADDSGLIPLLQAAVQGLHKCGAIHSETVSVHEQFQGRSLWQGNVEVFDLYGHPKAKRCFAWVQPNSGKGTRYVALLNFWPVTSPQAAVKAMIVMDIPIRPPNNALSDFAGD
jgi:hypothetical protein